MAELTRIRITVADDHPVFRAGLKQVLSSTAEFEVVAEAEDGPTALAQIQQRKPDIALLDFDLPALSGLDVLRQAKPAHPAMRGVLLTMHHAEMLVQEALDAGVAGYVLKDNATADLLSSLRTVARGGIYLSPAVSASLVRWTRRAQTLHSTTPGIADLSPTERRVLKLVAARKTSREIGNELFISHRTVETHRRNICEKLSLRGSNCLLQFAIENRGEL